MAEAGVPQSGPDRLTLPCGESVAIDTFDMGMREYSCACGEAHAVVMDVHPLGRWVPEAVEAILVETTEPADAYDQFGTIHLMGMVLEEYPDRVCVHDASEDPTVGWALLWVTQFDAVSLHELVVELLVELMDHAVGHIDDDEVRTDFGELLAEFDIATFVAAYRSERDLESLDDRGL